MKTRNILATVIVLAGFGTSISASAVTIGQVDTFEDGTTQGWLAGLLGSTPPAPPANVATGGPAGDEDNFLLLTSQGGLGAGSRLAVINVAQWAGDYGASGVTAISMDLQNLGDTSLSLRMTFSDPGVGPPVNLAFSTTPVLLSPGSGWQSVVFPILAGDLTAGLGSVATALANTTEVRLYHSVNPSFPGPPIAAHLGVDNIRAIPEAGTASLLALGLAGLAWRRRGGPAGRAA